MGSPWGTHGQVLLATDTETVAVSALTAGRLAGGGQALPPGSSRFAGLHRWTSRLAVFTLR